MARVRVLLADDHAEMLERVVSLVGAEFDVVGAVGDGQSVVDAVAVLQPDVVVLDISMPVMSGLKAAARLGESEHPPRIVFLTVHDDTAFVEAARAVGMGELRIAVRHVLPNTLAPLIVLATAQLGSAILVEASLSFLGLGIPEPHPSWGRMLSESAAEYVRTAPWLVIFPGVAISLTVFGTNLLGDALRDILDPRQRT